MAKFQVKLDLPEQPENAELEVLGFGLFLNGHSRTLELTEEQVAQFEASHGFTVEAVAEEEEVKEEESVEEVVPEEKAPAKKPKAAKEGGET